MKEQIKINLLQKKEISVHVDFFSLFFSNDILLNEIHLIKVRGERKSQW